MMQPQFRKLLPALVLAALAQIATADDAKAVPTGDMGGTGNANGSRDASDDSGKVAVYGHRETRQVENVSRAELQEAAPGTSALKVLEKLPGVEFQDADPFGNYEWAEKFSVRAFSQTYLGFTLDGIPLGDMSYGNNNGLNISRAISQENIRRESVAQGTGSLSTASTSNLGGTVQFYSDDPDKTFSTQAAFGFGSENAQREFVRVDTGTLPSGATAFVSYTNQRSDKWKGVGSQKQDMVNAKIVQPIGDGRLSFFFDHQERKEVDYQDMSMDMINKLGWNWDNYGSLQTAVNATKGIYTNQNVTNLVGVNALDAAYGGSSGLRKDDLFSLAFDLDLNDNTRFNDTVYYHHDVGQGHWVTPWVVTPNGLPVSARTTDYSIGREGNIADLTYTTGIHTVQGGVWLERSEHNLSRNYHSLYNVNSDNEDLDWLPMSDVFETQFNQQFITTTRQFYLEDTVRLLDDAATLNFGFKSPKVDIKATSFVPNSRAAGEVVAEKNFLPQIGFNYQIAPGQEMFASAAENMRAFQPGVDGIFSMTQANFDAIKGALSPETSTTFDLGYRFRNSRFVGLVDIYHTDFRNRLLQTADCAAIVGCPSEFHNVGKVTTNGIETALDTTLVKHVTWFNSLSYNISKYDSDYMNNGVVAVSGKDVVDAPRLMFTSTIGYDDSNWFGHFTEKYTAKRYYSYMNDVSVPAYWLAGLDAGYKTDRLYEFRDVRFTLDLTNAFDKRYVSAMGTNAFQASGDSQTLQVGSPRAIFFSVAAKY